MTKIAIQMPPWSNPANTRTTVIGTVEDIEAANAAGFKLEPHGESDHHRAEMMIFSDDKIDLAYGFRMLMEMAATYPSYEAVYARLTVPEDERLDYDGIIATDTRIRGCNDPRVILRELMTMFGDEQIRDLVTERIEAIKSGVTYSIHEVNAMQPPNIVEIGAAKSWAHEPSD